MVKILHAAKANSLAKCVGFQGISFAIIYQFKQKLHA